MYRSAWWEGFVVLMTIGLILGQITAGALAALVMVFCILTYQDLDKAGYLDRKMCKVNGKTIEILKKEEK